MPNNITICADDDIAAALEDCLRVPGEVETFRAASAQTCFAPSFGRRAKAIILQVRSPVSTAQDLMYELQSAQFYPVMLLFEVVDGQHLRYSTTDVDAYPFSAELARQFCGALEGRYQCEHAYFRTTVWDGDMRQFAEKEGHAAALRELLRGCTDEEFARHKERYGFDLRGEGYYLFFWELQYIEYVEHRIYKDLYNFLGAVLERDCLAAVDGYNGGEVFFFSLLQICVIINDLPFKSEAQKSARFEEMLRSLGRAAGCRWATRYLSKRIPDIAGIRVAYDNYAKEKTRVFFMREESIMRSYHLEDRRRKTTLAAVREPLQAILKYLRYDIENPQLTERLKFLYMDVLKPAMSYAMYYFSTAVICSEIAELQPSFDEQLLSANLSPNMIQFSSIEEQYENILSLIRELQLRSASRHKTKKSLLLKAMDYIEENYNRDITVADIAGALYISSVYLSQIFKSELDVSVIHYLINFRIEKAKALLTETDELVYYVAEQVGFHDGRHFSKTFKKFTGQTPAEYRTSSRGGGQASRGEAG